MWGVSLTHPKLAFYFCGEFVLHILSFFPPLERERGKKLRMCKTNSTGFTFMRGVSLTHPVLASFIFYIFYLGVSLTHPALVFIFMWGVSLTHPMLASSFVVVVLIWGISLTHPVLASYLCGEFLLQIPYWLYFYLGSFSYTSHACFLFLWGVCLTHT